MGYYKSKLNKYTKSVTVSPETMEQTRKNIIESLKNKIQEYELLLRHSAMAENLGTASFDDVRKDYYLTSQELNFLMSLDAFDFYGYLVNVENYNLQEVTNKALANISEISDKIKKYQEKQGVSGKVSAAFGLDKRKIEKNQKILSDNELTVKLAQDSREELRSLSQDEQIKYMMGRFEVDKKTKFDEADFNKYKEKYLAEQNLNAAQSK